MLVFLTIQKKVIHENNVFQKGKEIFAYCVHLNKGLGLCHTKRIILLRKKLLSCVKAFKKNNIKCL